MLSGVCLTVVLNFGDAGAIAKNTAKGTIRDGLAADLLACTLPTLRQQH